MCKSQNNFRALCARDDNREYEFDLFERSQVHKLDKNQVKTLTSGT